MEMDDEEKADAEKKTEDFRKLQEELQAAKPKGTVRAGPPQIERSIINTIKILTAGPQKVYWVQSFSRTRTENCQSRLMIQSRLVIEIFQFNLAAF